jgi:peptide/nickel transport system substrate-binding protein
VRGAATAARAGGLAGALAAALACASAFLVLASGAGCSGERASRTEDATAVHGTLRVGLNNFPASLGSPYQGNGRPGTTVWYALFDGLTELNEAGELVPALATSWRLETPTRWVFELRPGVKYANGRPFDAKAAARVIRWLGSKPGRATVIGNELRNVTSATAAAPLTLVLETKEVDPILPKRMVGALMIEPDAWEQLGPTGFAMQPVGTGAYVLERWDQRKRRAYAVRNPHAWRPAHYERMEWVELPDAAVRTQALLSRDVDIAAIEIEEMDRLVDRGYPIITAPSMSVMSIAFITERNVPPGTPLPLQDRRVRQALNYAVDRELIARVLLRGKGRPAGQPGPRGAFGNDPDLTPYPYDPARAKQLLAEAGYPNGFRLMAEVQPNAFPADGLIFQTAAHYLRQVGVELTLRNLTFPQYLRNLQRNTFTGDAFGTAWNSAPYNDVTRPMELFSCGRAKPFFCDRELTAELDRVKRILPEEERRAAMQQLARRYREAAPALFLVEQIDLYAHAPHLANVRIANRVPVYREIVAATAPATSP